MLLAQMVGRNEADRYLEEVLDHLRSIVDHIVFTDDASDDNTAEIAAKYATVYKNERPLFTEDEGLLRTAAWKNLQKHADVGDWILSVDCDEKLWCTQPNFNINKLMSQPMFDVINVTFFHMWNDTHYRVDKAWKPSGSFRLYRYFLGGRFKDKKLACGSEPMYVETLIRRGKFMRDTPLVMQHLGYMKDEDKQAKYERYMTLDQGNFHSLQHIQSIIDPDPVLEPWGNW